MNRLDAIKARAEAATPGPWVQGYPDDLPGESRDVFFQPEFRDTGEGYGATYTGRIYDEGGHTAADAAFIAYARTDVPLLLAVAEAAAALMDNHDLQRFLHRPDFRLFEERGGFPRAEELRMQERERKEALRAALAPLLEADR